MKKLNMGWVDKDFYLHCGCEEMDHMVRISFSKQEPDPGKDPNHLGDMFFIHYFLPTGRWYKRIWLALKYILGFKSNYGEFGETVIHLPEAKRLAQFLNDPEGTQVEDNLAEVAKLADA